MVCLAVMLAATVIPEPIGSGVPYVAMVLGEGLWGNAADSMFASERHMILVLQVANAAMFVPLGLFAYAAARRPSPLGIVLGCLALSIVIGLRPVKAMRRAGRFCQPDRAVGLHVLKDGPCTSGATPPGYSAECCSRQAPMRPHEL